MDRRSITEFLIKEELKQYKISGHLYTIVYNDIAKFAEGLEVEAIEDLKTNIKSYVNKLNLPPIVDPLVHVKTWSLGNSTHPFAWYPPVDIKLPKIPDSYIINYNKEI